MVVGGVTQHLQGLMVFCLAMFVTLTLIPLLMRYSERFGLMDVPKDARRMHVRAIPRSGGLAMAVGALLPVIIWLPSEALSGFVMAALVIVVFGVLDDRFDLHYRWKFAGQIIAVVVLMSGGVVMERMPLLGLDSAPLWLSYPVTFLFLLGAINSVNLSDGLDGLAAGTSLLALGLLVVVALTSGLQVEAMLGVALMGAIMGFLRYNTHPAQIFMGDTGSQFLGLSVVSLALMVSQSPMAPVSASLPLLALGLPILDTLMVMFIRLREGRSPFSPDKNHIHHQLMGMGLLHYQVVAVIYLLQILLISAAYLMRYAEDVWLLLFYLAFSGGVLGLLRLAKLRGWWFRREPGQERQWKVGVRRHVEWLRRWAHRCVYVGIVSVWLVAGTQLDIMHVDNDLMRLLALLGAASTLLLVRPWPLGARLCAYAISAGAVYVLSLSTNGDIVRLVDIVLVALVVALAVAIKVSSRDRFGLTTQDILVLFILVVVPFIPLGTDQHGTLAFMALRFAVLVYAIELLLSRGGRQPFFMVAAVLSALLLVLFRFTSNNH